MLVISSKWFGCLLLITQHIHVNEKAVRVIAQAIWACVVLTLYALIQSQELSAVQLPVPEIDTLN
jgi:hypothetical protein